jgi:hypothetical protein
MKVMGITNKLGFNMLKLATMLFTIIVLIASTLSLVSAESLWKQPVKVLCDFCNGSGKIEHTLTYKILADYEQTKFVVWGYPAGLYFRVIVTIENTDNYEGDFFIKVTIIIGGSTSFETRVLHLAPQESETVFFPSDTDWYWAGVLTHSHSWQVAAPQISITCSRCNGTGFVTRYVANWATVSATIAIAMSAVLLSLAFFIRSRKRAQC